MLAPETLTDLELSDEDFYRRDHQLIFRAIQEVAENGHAFDPVTLGEWFDAQGRSDEVANGAYLVELYTTTPSAANIKAYAAIVRNLATKRQLITLGTDMVSRGFNCAEPDEIISDGMGKLALAASRLSGDKQEPMDMFGDYNIPPLNPDWLPPGIAKYAYDQARVIGCAPEMVAFSCIATAAAATHDSIVVRPKSNEGWTERACLWVMVVAPPGSKKSVAVKRPQAPLRMIDSQLCDEFTSKNAEFVKEDKVFQLKQRAAIKNEASGKELGYEEPAKAPDRPLNRRAIVNDVTVEKMGELLMDNTRGLLMYQDEIAVWFGGHDLYNKGAGKDRGMAIGGYEGGSYTFDRIGRGTVRVPNWSYSLVGTTQPDKIREIISKKADDGLMQRFMIIEVPRQVLHGDEDRPEDATARKAYEDAIRSMWARVPTTGSDCVVELSPEADSVRRDFFQWVDTVSNTEGLPSMITGHLSKWTGLWPRLCLTYHSFGMAVSGKWPNSDKITGRTARRVTALMKQYLLPQALRFYADTAREIDPVFSLAQKLASMALAKGLLRVTNRDLTHAFQPWRSASPQQKVAVISLLRGSGWILGADNQRQTGAETAWAINPRVHILFGERAATEAAKRQAGAETMKVLRDAAAGRDAG